MYSNEKNIQIIVYLMKQYGIHDVVVCPGAGNASLLYTLQEDPFFKMYSVLDERSAAYVACGISEEKNAPVAISVTNNVAIRNTLPGMTEAYYRSLPILLLSSAFHLLNTGNNWPQIIDEKQQLADTQKMKINIPIPHTSEDEWINTVLVNKALNELTRGHTGPVHIHYSTILNSGYSMGDIPPVKHIRRITRKDIKPEINANKIMIYIGNHSKWNSGLVEKIDSFCEKYDAIVFCDHTSNFQGKYAINPAIYWNQSNIDVKEKEFDLVIYIGNISGSYIIPRAKEVWNIDNEGFIKDSFMKLTTVFHMTEEEFFEHYLDDRDLANLNEKNLYCHWQNKINYLRDNIPELPFSNIFVASHCCKKFPTGSTVYFSILNTLRCWNMFHLPESVYGYSNTGAFGIDGGMSTLIGMSLCNPDKLYFAIVGDLAFDFDMNILGNRGIGNNVRIMVINNNGGTEFKNYNHFASVYENEVLDYISASGHMSGNTSAWIKHYAENMGFKYLCATCEEEFLNIYEEFFDKKTSMPVLMEVITKSDDESEALRRMHNIVGENNDREN